MLRRLNRGIGDASGILRRDLEEVAEGVRGTRVFAESDAVNSRTLDDAGVGNEKSMSDNGKFDRTDYVWPDPPARISTPENAPQLIADEFERMRREGGEARWANYDPGAYRHDLRTLERWLRTEGPLAPLNRHYGLNCWEMTCYAAARAGVLDKPTLRELLDPPRDPNGRFGKGVLDSWLNRMGDRLIPGERSIYTGEPGGPRPQRGDLVMWGRDALHVSMATGRVGSDGSPEVYSFWPPPKHEVVHDPDTDTYSRVTDTVQVTTIDELSRVTYNSELIIPSGTEVIFGRGPW
ncbi:hypothetical protein IU459_17785 [Nocardia amamiensis]|uniref:Amidase domain-containing protein n=1 Tax=Nocardia amamiensis TaxID=404578 RepID=A0ABS0CRY9_9NOCA|nr:hypothetical protein [Nocardia amamiensis]